MRINVNNLIFQLLPVAKRQPKRLGVLNAIINLHDTWAEYEIWQRKYSRILHATSQKMKLERYLRDVFGCEDIFIRDRGTGCITVALRREKINNELIFGLRSAGEMMQRLQLKAEGADAPDYTVICPVSVSREKLIIELHRFNPVMKKYKIK